MARKMRLVEKIKGGDRFQEVQAKDWQEALAAYMADPKNVPAPMIQRHQMFKYPADYGCRLIEQ